MDVKELRIGNLVTDEYYEHFNTLITVESISEKGINLRIEDDGNYPECAKTWIEPDDRIDKLRGIPLSDELLEKTGAHKIKHIHGYSFFSFHNRKCNVALDIYETRTEFNGRTIKHIEFLHQLQNAWSIITGKELEIK